MGHRLRPFFPYYGSKWNIARHYPAPSHDRLVEPFAGSAGYATFHGWRSVLLVEADPVVAGVWSYLLQATAAEIMALPELPGIGDTVDDHDLPAGAKSLIGFWLNRGSAQPKKSRTAYSARSDKGQLNWGAAAKERIARQLPALAGWRLLSGSYHKAPDVAATWFIDPPYLDKGRYYRHRFNDYHTLATWCLSRRGQVITCEGGGARWLPFVPLGSFKSTLGKAVEVVHLREAA